MKDGDVAGLSCFQNRYGFVGVKRENGQFFVVMQKAMEKGEGVGKEIAKFKIEIYCCPLKVEKRKNMCPQCR